jgi:Lon protease-like protein
VSEFAELSALPVFPLAVVLLPGELLPLHIFEKRYQAMMAAVLDDGRKFGLSYVADAEVGQDSVPPPGSIGCVAQITAVIPLPEERLNILAVGATRYVIRRYKQYEPYLIAEVDPIADEPSAEGEIGALADKVRQLFGRLAAAARSLSNVAEESGTPKLDAEPEALSFIVAANVALDSDVKQHMLEMTDTRERLDQLHDRLLELVDTYEYRAEMHTRAKKNGHGEKLPEVEEEEEEEE